CRRSHSRPTCSRRRAPGAGGAGRPRAGSLRRPNPRRRPQPRGDPMKATPRVMARLAGGLYLVSAVPAGFSVWVFLKLVVRGAPAATAANILGSEALFRFGFVADLIGIMLVLGSTLVLYELFKPV